MHTNKFIQILSILRPKIEMLAFGFGMLVLLMNTKQITKFLNLGPQNARNGKKYLLC